MPSTCRSMSSDHELRGAQGCSYKSLPEQMGTLAHWAGVTFVETNPHLKYP